MRVNRGLLGWGLFFVALGLVPLAVQAGLLDAATASRAWQLWPLLLVAAGLGLALRRTSLAGIGGVLAAITLGVMAGGLVAGGFWGGAPFALCGTAGGQSPANGQPVNGTFGASGTVTLNLDCGSLQVATQPGSGWSVTWPSSGASTPDIESNERALTATFGQTRGLGFSDANARWTTTLPTDPALTVDVVVAAGAAKAVLSGAHVSVLTASVNAGDGRFDLSTATGVKNVTASVNAGTLSVALPLPEGTLSGSMSANVGTIRICTPPGAALRITAGEQPLGSNNFAQRGLVQSGSTWTRGNPSSAADRIELDVSATVGTITLDPEDGCG